MIVRLLAVLVFVAVAWTSGGAWAGHEIPFYPSFYAHEIKIEVMEPAAAARLLQKKSLHAYVGADPFAGGVVPSHVAYAESLKSYVVLTFGRSSGALADAGARCAAAARALKTLSTAKGAFTFHPYPVTPYHDDYLQHFDLVESARKKVAGQSEGGGPPLRLRAKGRLAEALVAAHGRATEKDWDATLEEIDVRDLLADRETRLNGWLGPPWLKQGWFQAYLLHAGTLADEGAGRGVEETLARRILDPPGPSARANLERKLVTDLRRGCERVAVGYTLKREALNVEYSDGVENIAYDAQGGLGSAIFLRDVKLKDFPWNGWLRLGSQARPASAWNPIAGFGDATGRLIWLAVGDPALFPAPNHGGWVPNRVRAAPSADGSVEIPPDALVPDAAAGALHPIGRGATAPVKVAYQVLASAFHDGTKMSPADIVYPFAFASRWSVREGRNGTRYDPVVDRATATLRERLAAVKVVRIDSEIKDYGEVQLIYDVPQVDVYLKRAIDPRYLAVVAPPWSAIPWELTVLMEEAVTRGLAAFSEAEAKRRGLPWLDLVRDRKLKDALASLADTFERRAYVPDALRGLVTVAEARQRWAALRRFHRQHGHFLVTNGPYRLEKWSSDSVVLGVFRDLSYPLPVGIYDQYALPLKAYVIKAEQRGDRLEIQADVEKVSKFERSYKIEREPFRPPPAGEQTRDALVAHYAVLSGGDQVVSAGTSRELQGDRLVVDLRGQLAPGAYRILVALALNGNLVNPAVKVLPYRVGD
ncbi:MAG: hypothetical protein AUH29_03100 [Candidatus Rokubacteria bacterium 13_1_40CM_69_27]|nr:MAG: hypothetical protein AUH29_03100 [Candidatus Rokubacteria bacterium 13_1_40CM_69_27]